VKIGVFDSGMGGLAITIELKKLFPYEDFICVADTFNFPYGIKSDEELQNIVKKKITILEEHQVDLIIVACNTASSIIERYNLSSRIELITIIDLTVNYALNADKIRNYLVLATKSTVNSKIYFNKLSKEGNIINSLDCQEFVDLVESGKYKDNSIKQKVGEHLSALRDMSFSSIILGCTHFILLEKEIKDLFPNAIMVNPIIPLQDKLKRITYRVANNNYQNNPIEIITTGNDTLFKRLANSLVMDDVNIKDEKAKIKELNIINEFKISFA
jgi:glutamate racemase